MTDVLTRLEEWFLQQCNDDWEHQYVIKVTTLDNPGWCLEVDLRGTPQSTKAYESIRLERSESDWIHCRVQEGRFEGFCGPRNLRETIEIFLDWTDRP